MKIKKLNYSNIEELKKLYIEHIEKKTFDNIAVAVEMALFAVNDNQDRWIDLLERRIYTWEFTNENPNIWKSPEKTIEDLKGNVASIGLTVGHLLKYAKIENELLFFDLPEFNIAVPYFKIKNRYLFLCQEHKEIILKSIQ